MLKAKGEVIEELEKVADVTEAGYLSAVDMVARKYNDLKQIDPEELEAFITDMKEHWDGIKGTVEKAGKTVKKSGKKVAKKSSKK